MDGYNANELITWYLSSDGTYTMTYDDWGRMTRSAKGGDTWDYSYRYGGKFYGFTSSTGSDTVYDYRGDGMRWKRSVDGTWANVYYWG